MLSVLVLLLLLNYSILCKSSSSFFCFWWFLLLSGICTYLYIAVQLFYMGLVIFVPSTAMEAMTDFPLWGSVIITGTIATIYTTLVSSHIRSLFATSEKYFCTMYYCWLLRYSFANLLTELLSSGRRIHFRDDGLFDMIEYLQLLSSSRIAALTSLWWHSVSDLMSMKVFSSTLWLLAGWSESCDMDGRVSSWRHVNWCSYHCHTGEWVALSYRWVSGSYHNIELLYFLNHEI